MSSPAFASAYALRALAESHRAVARTASEGGLLKPGYDLFRHPQAATSQDGAARRAAIVWPACILRKAQSHAVDTG
jgi:hypothetical protein